MNDIQNLIDRQLGIYCQLNYDNILKRLVVDSEESFYGLQSANVVASFDQDPPIFACRFSEAPGYEHILALANEDGRVAIQNTTNLRTASTVEGFQCHNNAVFDLAWMPGHMSFVTVSGDHTAILWDVAEGAPRKVCVFSKHTRSVKTAAFRPLTGGVLATGARDGNVLVWDVRSARPDRPELVLKPDNCLAACHACFAPKTPASHAKRVRLDHQRAISITGLVFQDDHTLISCGECDGSIKVWDLRKSYSGHTREPLPKHSIPYCGSSTRNGYTNLITDDAGVRLYASCMDSVIYCFNISTYTTLPERRYTGHECGTFYIKASLSPDCRYLVSGSSDKNAYVWNVRYSEPLVKLTGHRAEVTCAAWSRGRRRDLALVTCSDDARHKLWRLGPLADRPPAPASLQGRAEPVPRREPAAMPPDRTPTSLKRHAATPLSTTTTTTTTVTPPATKRARSHATSSRKTKRCLADSMNASAGLGPGADAGPDAKRLRPEGARLLPAGVKRPRPAAADASPERRTRADALGAEYRGHVPPDAGAPCVTPTKGSGSDSCISSPAAVRRDPGAGRSGWSGWSGSPTLNLPDFVLDGEAPHLRLMSPAKKKRDTTNWLTLIVRERRGKFADAGAPPDVAAPPSPRESAPARRSSTTDRTPKSNKKSRTLLKYFSVASKQDT